MIYTILSIAIILFLVIPFKKKVKPKKDPYVRNNKGQFKSVHKCKYHPSLVGVYKQTCKCGKVY